MLAFFALAAVAYLMAAPDSRTLAASRGAAGASRSAAAGGVRQVGEDWRAGRPARQSAANRVRGRMKQRTAGAVLVGLWDALRFTGRAGRGGARTGYRAGRAAYREACTAYQPAAERARLRRARRLAKRRVAAKKRAAAAAPTTTPTPITPDPAPGAGSTSTLEPTGDTVRLKTMDSGEMNSTSDLRGEAGELRGIVEELREVLDHLNKYLNGLGDRYVGAPFGTEKLSRAVTGLGEQAKAVDPAVADHILEQADALDEALTEADNLAEHASSVKAEGEIDAFQPA